MAAPETAQRAVKLCFVCGRPTPAMCSKCRYKQEERYICSARCTQLHRNSECFK